MNRRGSQPMLMPQIEHHIDKNITITNVRTSMINIVQQKEKLACVCGRIQHIPYPRARCICGKLPLKIMRAIEDEKLRRIKEIEDRAKQKRNEKENLLDGNLFLVESSGEISFRRRFFLIVGFFSIFCA